MVLFGAREWQPHLAAEQIHVTAVGRKKFRWISSFGSADLSHLMLVREMTYWIDEIT